LHVGFEVRDTTGLEIETICKDVQFDDVAGALHLPLSRAILDQLIVTRVL
jgi:hypothetical protein